MYGRMHEMDEPEDAGEGDGREASADGAGAGVLIQSPGGGHTISVRRRTRGLGGVDCSSVSSASTSSSVSSEKALISTSASAMPCRARTPARCARRRVAVQHALLDRHSHRRRQRSPPPLQPSQWQEQPSKRFTVTSHHSTSAATRAARTVIGQLPTQVDTSTQQQRPICITVTVQIGLSCRGM